MLGCLAAVWATTAALLVTAVAWGMAEDAIPSRLPAAGLPFTAPCEIDRKEVVFPQITTTARGRSAEAWKVGSRLPSTFHVTLTWKGRLRQLTLFQSDVASPGMVTVYEEDTANDTVAETDPDNCQYQGFVPADRSSFAAVSVCDGLAGYIHTGRQMLFIQPAPVPGVSSPLWDQRPHLMYTCRDGHTSGANRTEDAGPFRAGPRPGRRQRRSPDRVRYLEVQLVVDHTVLGMHGTAKRVRRYVMTLMNIANSVYQHPSLGVNIRVVVTELVLLQRREQEDVLVKRDAFSTVRKFCQWSNRRHSPASGIRHDIALLLTRENLGPAGYAPITGMCNPIQACATVTDEGFSSGFIIAHEMAHVFGLVHDGQDNSCSGARYRTAIMAPLVEAKLNRFWWSECSRLRMQQIIGYLFCLNDNPDIDSSLSTHYLLDSGHELHDEAGREWSLNFQCRLEFGYRFRLCPAFRADACNVLWCSDSSSPFLCRTKRGPPMPGSNCGYGMECRDRRCVRVGRRWAVHGEWGTWGAWGDCNVRCGIGVKKRRRFCSDPRPSYGGRDCYGSAESWDTCVGKHCDHYHDPRAIDCEAWNELNIRAGSHDWKPYQAEKERDRCKQTCVSSTTGEVVTSKVDVSDGTPCDYDQPTNICVSGKCLAVGCDGLQNSTKAYDSCGVCGGDDSLCKTVSGHFTRQPSSENKYEPVVFLPKWSRNIEVEQRGKAKHFIALRDPSQGSYVLNGGNKREDSRHFIVAGARFEYDRGYGFQRIRTLGPLHAELEVMLYPGRDLSKPSVTYEYNIGSKDLTQEKRRYTWKLKEWSPCSATCGEGVTAAKYVCYDNDSGGEHDEDLCKFLRRPRKNEAPCFGEPCPQKKYVWNMTDSWSTCSAEECGQEGVETQHYICQLVFLHNDTYLTVDRQLCDQHTAPIITRACSTPPCGLTWTTERWSQCSVTCGQGQQTRKVHCGNPDTDSDDVWCKDDLPALSRACFMAPCRDHLHEDQCRDQLSLCPQSDGLGLKCHSRRFHDLCCKSCRRQQNAARRPRPSHRVIYKWVLTGEWSTCQAERCEQEGVQTEGYICQVYFQHNHTHLTVSHQRCDTATAPLVTRTCVTPSCDLTWTTGEWTQCSVTCGRGQKTRKVYCGDPDTDSDDVWCKDDPPALSRRCVMKPCKGSRGKRHCRNKYSFCARSLGLSLKCSSKRFRNICCRACRRWRWRSSRRPGQRKLKRRRLRRRRY